MNKYEQLIEFIINEQEDKARELFHQIVVEKSREIYENLIDEEDEEVDESLVDPMAGLVDEVDAEEQGMAEDDDEMDMDDMGGGEPPMDDMGGDMDAEMGADDMGGGGDIEDRVMDLEAALDELKAEFDALMADEQGEPEHADMGDMGGDDMGDMGGEEPEPKEAFVREYVDKVPMPNNKNEGGEVGTGGSAPINKKSITDNMKNDMGGSNANIVKGGTEQAADGKPTPKPSNAYSKGQTEHELGKRNVNQPGGNKGAQDWYNKKGTSYEKAKGKEGQTTSGSMSVEKKSINLGR